MMTTPVIVAFTFSLISFALAGNCCVHAVDDVHIYNIGTAAIRTTGQGSHDGPSGGRESGRYGDLRIEGGGDSGRLEFKDYDGGWGTVCDHGFDREAGDVACKQMGYRRSDEVLDHQQ